MPIPYLIILDRDKKSDGEIENLKQKYNDNLKFLECYEIENNLINPEAISYILNENGKTIDKYEVNNFINNYLDEKILKAVPY